MGYAKIDRGNMRISNSRSFIDSSSSWSRCKACEQFAHEVKEIAFVVAVDKSTMPQKLYMLRISEVISDIYLYPCVVCDA